MSYSMSAVCVQLCLSAVWLLYIAVASCVTYWLVT